MANFKFCPKCAGEVKNKKVHGRKRLVCAKCSYVFYQNPKPTVGVFIIRDKKVLLAERRVKPFKGWWDSIGGFMEIGESPQETAIRETKEETGLNIKLLEFLGAGKDYYNDLIVVPISFIAKIEGGRIRPGDDVAKLKWFSINSLPGNIAFTSNLKALKLLQKKLTA